MAFEIRTLIDSETAATLGDSRLDAINESVQGQIDAANLATEKDLGNRFNRMVEKVNATFEAKVNSTVLESVRSGVGTTINSKLYSVVHDIVGLLEGSGLFVSEDTKQIGQLVKAQKAVVAEEYNELTDLQKQQRDSEKNDVIITTLSGSVPEIISAALQHFKDADPSDVTDRLVTEWAGKQNMSEIANGLTPLDIPDNKIDKNLTLSDVSSALESIESGSMKSKGRRGSTVAFESLGRGLSAQKVFGAVRNSGSDDEFADSDDDTSTALGQINDFNQLGYRFR